MNTCTEHFTSINTEKLREINGGGFAYDVGRVIRYFVISGGGIAPIGIATGLADWIGNDVANQIANS